MHICSEEVLMFMAAIPIVGLWWQRFRAWYHLKMSHKCHTAGCEDTHAEHKESHDDSRAES